MGRIRILIFFEGRIRIFSGVVSGSSAAGSETLALSACTNNQNGANLSHPPPHEEIRVRVEENIIRAAEDNLKGGFCKYFFRFNYSFPLRLLQSL